MKNMGEPLGIKNTPKSTNLLDLIHSDLSGNITTPSLSKSHYFLLFIDDFSRFTTIYKIMVENKFQTTVKLLRSNNGREYQSL